MFEFKVKNDIKDNLGNSYNYGITGSNDWQTYYINGAYSKMKGRYILSYDSRSAQQESRLKIYGDGKLIYSSLNITGGVHPIDIEIDLTGALELKIEFIRLNDSQYLNKGQTYLVNTGLYQ